MKMSDFEDYLLFYHIDKAIYHSKESYDKI